MFKRMVKVINLEPEAGERAADMARRLGELSDLGQITRGAALMKFAAMTMRGAQTKNL